MTEVKNCNNRLLRERVLRLPRLIIPQINVNRVNQRRQEFHDINNGNLPPPEPLDANNVQNPFDGHNRGGQV